MEPYYDGVSGVGQEKDICRTHRYAEQLPWSMRVAHSLINMTNNRERDILVVATETATNGKCNGNGNHNNCLDDNINNAIVSIQSVTIRIRIRMIAMHIRTA